LESVVKTQAEPAARTLMLIMNDPKILSGIEPRIIESGFKIIYATTLPLALGVLQRHPIDVVMISWNLHLIDVQRTYEFLDVRLQSLVVVFSEFDRPEITKQLVDSRIEKTVFPPLTGHSVIARLYQLMRRPDTTSSAQPRVKKDLGVEAITGDQVPADVVWDGSPPTDGVEDRLWQGVSTKDESSTYIYQGRIAPAWNGKVWVVEPNAVLKVAKEARASLGPVLRQPIRKEAKITVLGRETEVKKYVMPPVREEDGSNHFFVALSNAIGSDASLCNPMECTGETDRVVISWINSPPLRGFIVVSDPMKSAQAVEIMERAQDGLETIARDNNSSFEVLMDKVSMEVPLASASLWISRQTKYNYGVNRGGHKFVLAFVPIENQFQFGVESTGQRYAISIGDAIRSGAKVPVDLFIFMKKNSRYIKYIAKDTVVNEATISKLTRSDIHELLLNKEDLSEFLLYKARYYLGLIR
jgi:hypothetical protein